VRATQRMSTTPAIFRRGELVDTRLRFASNTRGIRLPMGTPGNGGQPTFSEDIRPLFRERDRGAMLSVAAFDLWKHKDVAEHSQAILGRLEEGSMPCDERWPDDQIAVFRRWVAAGMPD
jgi:hypothetical protein